MNKKYPSISIITSTYNPDPSIFEKSLKSINDQDYPNKIEHILNDGGSDSKDFYRLAKKYRCKIVSKPELRYNGEARRTYGLKLAKNDIILWLESDNFLDDKDSLKKLMRPFLDDEKIIATYTLHYGHNKNLSYFNRYCGFFGGPDPVAYYLGKTDREPWFINNYSKGNIIKSNKNYIIVEFNEKTLPTVGDNGCAVKREILLKAQITPDYYFHTDVFVDLIKLGYSRFGVVKNTTITHFFRDKNLIDLIKRRGEYYTMDSTRTRSKNKRYYIYNNSVKDFFNLSRYILYTITLIQPLYLSIIGYIKINDWAWFIHSIVCFLYLIFYSVSMVKIKIINFIHKNGKNY